MLKMTQESKKKNTDTMKEKGKKRRKKNSLGWILWKTDNK